MFRPASPIISFVLLLAGLGVITYEAFAITPGAPSDPEHEMADVIDIYAGVALPPDMMRCCDCHKSKCYGGPDERPKQPQWTVQPDAFKLQRAAATRPSDPLRVARSSVLQGRK